ncbi:lipid-A-disaccharide synthase [Geobacter sp. DSM 9736]|uniref:lipid-A-disaccharide synthase n=1 Tax=Geobacter sp. DSM 9736 TaxID=1277350 RepID=UPI000B4FF30F|nr:lipid-A-disaccharide synthase [Geobacter sp. DSM 9736]SNB45016.1 lipid-A-disaccharide synthase [Geobacter sp. DSM 9736]
MIVAGEASGDLHGAGLIREARRMDEQVTFFGIGGARMREAGAETLVDASDMAVVGLFEVAAHFDVIYRAYATLRDILRKDPPDLLILIDYPDFNLRLAKVAKRAGVRVLYYISPQVWAWRVGRVKKIARLVDRMAVVFPFEVPFYEKEGVPVSFVGHPLLDVVHPTMSPEEARAFFGLDSTKRTVGLFPGSRRGEIKRLLPVILETALLLRGRFPDLQFVLPLASSLNRQDLAPHLEGSGLNITVVEGKGYDVMQVCDAIISVSGTVTLEIALIGTPMVIIYRVSPFTYQVAKRLVRVDHIGLCNIVAGERAVRELVQDEARPEIIADEITRILTDDEYAASIRSKLVAVRGKLGCGGCSAQVARLALDMLA